MRLMKIFLCTVLLSSLVFMYNSTQIVAASEKDESILIIAGRKELKELDQSQLEGTPLYGKYVTYNLEGDLFINGQRAIDPISLILGVLVGWLINGTLIYATGYSGDQIAAYTIKACWELTMKIALIETIYIVSAFDSKPSGYKTKSGQQCSLNASGTAYNCAYSV